jgi:hypothetical protein
MESKYLVKVGPWMCKSDGDSSIFASLILECIFTISLSKLVGFVFPTKVNMYKTLRISFLVSSFVFNDCKDLAGCFSNLAI